MKTTSLLPLITTYYFHLNFRNFETRGVLTICKKNPVGVTIGIFRIC